MDKLTATFVGRPPLLSRKYCAPNLPLDLDDSALLSTAEEMGRAIQNLRPDGWNTENTLRAATMLRPRMQIAIVRDEILEYALGHEQDYRLEDLVYVMHSQLPILPRTFTCRRR
jgi:hypothetical protein